MEILASLFQFLAQVRTTNVTQIHGTEEEVDPALGFRRELDSAGPGVAESTLKLAFSRIETTELRTNGLSWTTKIVSKVALSESGMISPLTGKKSCSL